jgi:hypothetical protein
MNENNPEINLYLLPGWSAFELSGSPGKAN